MHLKTFGKNPSGEYLQKIQASPNYSNGSFKNLQPTSLLTQPLTKTLQQYFKKHQYKIPPKPLPSVKTNLHALPQHKPVIIWFGHSSYLIKINGKHILVDPVFSGHASPFSSAIKSFAGTDIFSVDDMPQIDVLLLTHDHFDHLDYETVMKLKHKTRMVCTSLGVASHLKYWGFNSNIITEFDWWQQQTLFNGFTLTAVPARHFSGRTFLRNKTLWSAFVLQTNQHTLFLGGDSGYGNHFKIIHEKFPAFDIALLECGQYNVAWHDIHMLPEETAQASLDLHAKVLMPVHWAKFALSMHAWNEPVQRLSAKASAQNIQLTTPLIGEPVIIDEHYPQLNWWLDI